MGTPEGLYRIRKGRCTYVPSDTPRVISIGAIHAGLNGELWIGHTMGLSRFENGRLLDFGSRLGIPLKSVSSFAETPDGSLWFGASTGLYRLKEGKVSVLKGVNGLASDTVRALEVDGRGTLWIGTNGGLNRWFNGLVPDPVGETLSYGVVQSIYQGTEGSLWFGTYGGLHQLRDYTFETYGSAEGLTNNDVNTLFEDRSGELWAGSWGGGLESQAGRSLRQRTVAARVTTSAVVFHCPRLGWKSLGCDGRWPCSKTGRKADTLRRERRARSRVHPVSAYRC